MELENMSRSCTSKVEKEEEEEEDDDDVPLPGFRFHPTDEELVGFYLRRKIEKKPLSIELIKQADIYKYDPWDLPKSSTVGDKEWYFFCKRGRKYRNSIRPNRVTGSGFWKATGIDRPIYSSGGEGRDCVIGLKKSLVYYRGSAGKGTKTDWMMHEFRLPPTPDKTNNNNMDAKTIAQEAEVWTLCRILKRNNSYRKLIIPDWREMDGKRNATINTYYPPVDASSKTRSLESSDKSNYISFSHAPVIRHEIIEKKPYSYNVAYDQQFPCNFSSASVKSQPPSITSSSSNMCAHDINQLLRNADWEDLQSIVDCAAAAATATTTNPFPL